MKKVSLILIAVLTALCLFAAPFAAADGEEPGDASYEAESDGLAAQADGSATEEMAQTGLSGDEAEYPVITGITNTDNGARLRWDAYEDAASYKLFCLCSGEFKELAVTSDTQYLDTTVADGEKRVYTLLCLDASGDPIGEYDPEGWENTFFAPPVISTVENVTGGVRLTWNKPADAEAYIVFRRDAGSSWTALAKTFGSEYTDKTASSGTTYDYTVRMVAADSSRYLSGHNNGKTIRYVAAPKITSFTNTDKGAEIRWEKSDGAQNYRIYYRSGNSWNRLATLTGTTYTDKGVSDAVTRKYTVRCVDNNGDFQSDFYAEGWDNTFFAPPVITSIKNTTEGVALKWNKPNGAPRYRVYRKVSGGSWQRLGETESDSYTDETAASGTTYTYTVRMISADSLSFVSDHNGGKSIFYVAAPKIGSVKNTSSGAEVKWDEVKGAYQYRVYYWNGKTWVRLSTQRSTTYTDKNVTNGEQREYTVRCLDKNEDFVSAYYNNGAVNTYFSAPVLRSIEMTDDGIAVSWKYTDNAPYYMIFRKDSGTSWKRVGVSDGSSYTDGTAETGVGYTYTVRVITENRDAYLSDYDGKGISLTAADKPAIASLENGDNGVIIRWKKVENAEFYRIYYRSGDSWVRLASKYLNEFTDTSIKDGETRVYTIRCLDKNENFCSSFSEEGWSNTYFAAPKLTSVEASDGGNLVKWEAREGAAAYRLYRKNLNGSWSRLFDSTTDTEYTDTSVSADRVYAYTLRYLDEDGELISSYISDTEYYKEGVLCSGTVTDNGVAYSFTDGLLNAGFRRIDGKLYYYDSKEKIVKNNIVGSDAEGWYYAGADGICCESEEIRLAAEFLMKDCKGSTLKERAKYGFMFMAKNFPYARRYGIPKKESDMSAIAVEMFQKRAGNCYSYAAAYACVCRVAGYRARVYVGNTAGSEGWMPHGWTEVYVDGKWLYCDVDANIPNYNVPDYYAYMMKEHCWYVEGDFWAEIVIDDNGTAKWI